MATEITTLRERLVADLAAVRPCGRMLPEVITQVAALAKGGRAAVILAAEEELHTVRVLITNLDNLVPLGRDSVKIFNDG